MIMLASWDSVHVIVYEDGSELAKRPQTDNLSLSDCQRSVQPDGAVHDVEPADATVAHHTR